MSLSDCGKGQELPLNPSSSSKNTQVVAPFTFIQDSSLSAQLQDFRTSTYPLAPGKKPLHPHPLHIGTSHLSKVLPQTEKFDRLPQNICRKDIHECSDRKVSSLKCQVPHEGQGFTVYPSRQRQDLLPRLPDPYLIFLLEAARNSGVGDQRGKTWIESGATTEKDEELLKTKDPRVSSTSECYVGAESDIKTTVTVVATGDQQQSKADTFVNKFSFPFQPSAALHQDQTRTTHNLEANVDETKDNTDQERIFPLSGRSYSFESGSFSRPKSKFLKRSGSHSDISGVTTPKTMCSDIKLKTVSAKLGSTSNVLDRDAETKVFASCSRSDNNRTLFRVQCESTLPNDIKHSEMYQTFQGWAIKNYGDTGKTKTVTRNKYQRIVRILTGEEQFSAENSKFRFWVKAKGFRLSLDEEAFGPRVKLGERSLLVPAKHMSEVDGNVTFKKVAVVENFFDIIYNVHVEMDGRGGKHAGQKRTYRAIAETYSFLPREAVTRFLMSCTDCQKRMHLSLETNNNLSSADDNNGHLIQDETSTSSGPPVIDYKLPITQTYLHHMRLGGKAFTSPVGDLDDESMSSDSILSRETSPSPKPTKEVKDEEEKEAAAAAADNNNSSSIVTDPSVEESMTSARRASPQTMEAETRASDSPLDEVASRKNSPVPGKMVDVGKGHPERKRRASSESGDSAMTKTSEGKDDDDDDDNDDDEKIPVGQDIDPERLKAFNMFVRLFVDENLDRMVPISKQPKDKIQAILEACDRQFPEFHERSRKRIRTYLKSCRRMRRSKEHNGWEPLRPTPPHLTSAAAESLLATACENESQNAKRMRLGLEPLPASAMVAHNSLVSAQTPPTTQQSAQQQPPPAVTQTPSQPGNLSSPRSINCSVPATTDFLRHQPPPPTFRPAPDFTPSFFTNGHGAALFRPGFPNYQHPAHHHPSVLPHAPITSNAATNGEFGPTDLSMKKSSNKGQLSPSEVTAIKQLIAGYRESAAFLYRSADELEQLLLQQN